MKKWMSILLAGVMLVGLCGCNNTPDVSDDDSSVTTTTATITATTTSTTTATTDHQTPLNIPQQFLHIINDQQEFYFADYNAEDGVSSYYLSDFLAEYRDAIGRYTLIDMDGDNQEELIMELEREEDKLIIRKDGSSFIGFRFGLRGMYRINIDGSFLWNTKAGKIFGCSKLQFNGNEYNEIELWRMELSTDNTTFEYFVDGKSVSEEYFNSKAVESDEIVWHQWEDNP